MLASSLTLLVRLCAKGLRLSHKIGALRVRLAPYRHVFARRHRHCTGNDTGITRKHQLAWTHRGRGYPAHEAASRKHSPIDAKDGGSESPGARDKVGFMHTLVGLEILRLRDKRRFTFLIERQSLSGSSTASRSIDMGKTSGTTSAHDAGTPALMRVL
jgi:hypothetical protein